MEQYLAGFFDADGSITLVRHKQNETRRLAIALTNTDQSTLTAIKNFLHLKGLKGHIVTYGKAKEHHLQAFDIRLYGHHAEKFMLMISTFTLNRKKLNRWNFYQQEYKPLKKSNGKYSEVEKIKIEEVANVFLSIK